MMKYDFEEMKYEIYATNEEGFIEEFTTCTGFSTAKKEFRKAIVERFSGIMDKYISLINKYCEKKYPQGMPIEISNLVDLLNGISSNADYVPDVSKDYAFDNEYIVITVDEYNLLSVSTFGDTIGKFPVLEFYAFEMDDPRDTYSFSISDEKFVGDTATIEISMSRVIE